MKISAAFHMCIFFQLSELRQKRFNNKDLFVFVRIIQQ